MDKRKWLIIYVSAGEGHRRAGEALYNYIHNNFKDTDIEIVDALNFTHPFFKNLYKNGYRFLVKHTPLLWKIVYIFSRIRFLKSVRFLVNRLNTGRLNKYLKDCQPQVVIVTHFLPQEVVLYLKKKKIINAKLAVVITDFSVHPFWALGGVDKYMVASDFTYARLVSYGIEKEKIFVTGIPVDLKFSVNLNRDTLYKKFGIRENNFTVLVVMAGFGLKVIEKIAEILHKHAQMIIVCGHNQKLLEILQHKGYPQVKIFGFVENMEELMSVCDVIITKGGGLTISEALAKELPMFFVSSVFGQETENAQIIQKLGAGFLIKDLNFLKDLILKYKSNPDLLNQLRRNILLIRKPLAAKEIVDALR